MTYLAVASFPYFTGLPEDVVVNTWHFLHPIGTPGETEFALLNADLATFYASVYHNTAGIGHAPWLRPLINSLTIYDLDDPSPRPPIYEAGMALTLGTVSSSSVTAPETALCLSYQADGEAGIPQARRRGRIFLGGLLNPISAGGASAFPSIGSGQRTIVANAASALLEDLLEDDWIWVVHSRTAAGDAAVTNGWVDDEIDTQRRRGREPSTRTTWS